MKKISLIFCTALFSALVFTGCATNGLVNDSEKMDFTGPEQTAKEDDKTPEAQIITLQESFDYLETNIKYPQFENKALLNKMVENSIKSYYSSFKKSCQEEHNNAAENNESLMPYEYTTAYEYFLNGNYTSVLISTYVYTGGAHGSTFLTTYNYNESTKKLDNIITSVCDYTLEEISEYCKKDIIKQLNAFEMEIDEAWIDEGTAPLQGNYQIFVIDKNNLKVYFDEYKAAPYAAGILQVVLPLKK